MQWLDPSLAEAAGRLSIYQQLKVKANAYSDLKKLEEKEEGGDNEHEEKVKHDRWLRKLRVK